MVDNVPGQTDGPYDRSSETGVLTGLPQQLLELKVCLTNLEVLQTAAKAREVEARLGAPMHGVTQHELVYSILVLHEY